LIGLREKAGELVLLQAEDHVYLTRARIPCVLDFKCQEMSTGDIFWIEAKGFANDRWPIIKKLWPFYGPGRLEIWMGSYSRIKLSETIIPNSGGDE
jgi:hypothetical protein